MAISREFIVCRVYRISYAAVAATAISAAAVSVARAQETAGTVQDPPKARIERVAPRPMLESARAVTAPGGEAKLTLRIGLTEATIRNPATKQLDKVLLRSYTSEGAPSGANAPFVAPTIEVFPGDTVRITLKNDLPDEPDCDKGDVNTPHCYNTTNLHGHGLAVSPSGNSDNVLISIRPQVEFQYEYNIPADHPAGTFWYHPHRHGSTALQVGSGMAGALIVRGGRLPTPTTPGDIDTLLRLHGGEQYLERVMVFQQIPYACREADGTIKTNKDDGTWRCDPLDVGGVDDYKVFTPTGWKTSGRYTTINGRTVEPLAPNARLGRVERWRLVHAGVRDTIKLSIRKRLEGSRASYEGLRAADQAAWIDANCDKDPNNALPQYEIATDGLTREQMAVRRTNWLQPGYRSDVLVVFPTAGEYCVIDEEASADESVNGQGSGRQLLTVVTVDFASIGVGNIDQYMKQELRIAAERHMPEDMRKRVSDDINNLRLSAFAAHTSIANVKPSNTQHLWFGFPPGVGDSDTTIRPYDPDRIDRQLTLGATEDWNLRSKASGHPFHIHINPFEVLSIVDTKTNADLTMEPTSEYFGLKGTWKDTLFVQQNATLNVRTQYRRYIGDFVLHCHILDHEDTGMMQNVRIALPDGKGGQEPAGHGARHTSSGSGASRP